MCRGTVGAGQRPRTIRNSDRLGQGRTHNPGTFGFALVPTYDLMHATYTSDYLYFTSKEIRAHDGSELNGLTRKKRTW